MHIALAAAAEWDGRRHRLNDANAASLTGPDLLATEVQRAAPAPSCTTRMPDEMAQMAMGMMGFWITHPKDNASADRAGDRRDF